MRTIERAADRGVLDHYGPASLVVDADLRVVLVQGAVDDYLAGDRAVRAGLLADVLRPELAEPARAVAARVFAGERARSSPIGISVAAGAREVIVEGSLLEADERSFVFLVF